MPSHSGVRLLQGSAIRRYWMTYIIPLGVVSWCLLSFFQTSDGKPNHNGSVMLHNTCRADRCTSPLLCCYWYLFPLYYWPELGFGITRNMHHGATLVTPLPHPCMKPLVWMLALFDLISSPGCARPMRTLWKFTEQAVLLIRIWKHWTIEH